MVKSIFKLVIILPSKTEVVAYVISLNSRAQEKNFIFSEINIAKQIATNKKLYKVSLIFIVNLFSQNSNPLNMNHIDEINIPLSLFKVANMTVIKNKIFLLV